MSLDVTVGKHPMVDRRDDRPCVRITDVMVELIDKFGENTCSFVGGHLLQRRYKLIDNLV